MFGVRCSEEMRASPILPLSPSPTLPPYLALFGAQGSLFGAGNIIGASVNCFLALPRGGNGSPFRGGRPGGSVVS